MDEQEMPVSLEKPVKPDIPEQPDISEQANIPEMPDISEKPLEANPYIQFHQSRSAGSPGEQSYYVDNTAQVNRQTAMSSGREERSDQVNALAIVSLVLGILSIVFCCCIRFVALICGIVGLICAIMGNKQSKSGIGTAGLVCSIIGLALSVPLLLLNLLSLITGGMFSSLLGGSYF